MRGAAAALRALRDRGLTLATAESLTGGALASALVDVPGASAVMRGGIVAYATDVKASVLGVDRDLLASRGAVDPDVAAQMAARVRVLLGADIGLATTGVAGPDPQDGRPVGTVFIAIADAQGPQVRDVTLEGTRATIRMGTVDAVLEFLDTWLSVTPR